MIRIEKLHKRYGRLVAVDNIDLEISAGEVFGFLGPNGAGKTTTMKIMVGLARPTSGRVVVGGYDVHRQPVAAKSLIGYIPDRPFIYEKLTGREFLAFVAGLYGREQAAANEASDLLNLFHIEERSEELVETYSHGMRQRLVMAAALVHRPRLLVVDEPMVGLDPRGAELVKSLFRSFAAEQGGTVFLSTHTLEVAEQVCDRVAIINHGRLVAQGSMADLRRRAGSGGTGRLQETFLRLTEKRPTPAGDSPQVT